MHRVVAQLKRRLATQGHETRGRRTHAHVDVRRTMRASLQTGGVPVVLKYRARSARAGRSSTCSATSRQRHQRLGLLPLRPARAARLVPQDALVRLRRADLRGDRRLRARAQLPAVSEAIGRDAGVADVSGYTDYGRVWSEFLALVEDDLHPRATVIVLGDARTNGRDPRADVFAAHRRARGAHVLAQPRAAAVLELRRLGRAAYAPLLRGARVLDDAPARGLRQGAHAPAARLRPASQVAASTLCQQTTRGAGGGRLR